MKIVGLLGARRLGGIVVCTIILLLTRAGAASPLANLFYAADVPVVLGELTANPNLIVADDLKGSLSPVVFLGVPSSTAVHGYVRMASGAQLIVFAPAVELPSKGGSIIATPRDVVSFDGTTYSVYFNGDDPANGIPAGVAISALTTVGSNLAVALDTTVALPGAHGATITAGPGDLVEMNGTGPPYSLIFDGGVRGLPPGIGIAAAAYLPASGHYLLVFDGTGSIGGENFTPRTILEFAPPADWSSIGYDGEDELGSAKLRAVFAAEPTPTITPIPTGTATATATSTPTITPTPTPTVVPVTIEFTPKLVRFPAQKLGKTGTTSAARYIKITNPRKKAGVPVLFSPPHPSGQEFAVMSNTCAPSLAPGKSCRVGLTFTPSALGPRAGAIQIIDNARNGPQTVRLAGVSKPASITVKPARVAFGKVRIGGGIASKTAILSNPNRVPLEVDAIELIPIKASQAEFSIPAGQCIGELAPGATCAITVSFKPAAKGARSARIGITDDAKGSPQRVSLTGSGK